MKLLTRRWLICATAGGSVGTQLPLMARKRRALSGRSASQAASATGAALWLNAPCRYRIFRRVRAEI